MKEHAVGTKIFVPMRSNVVYLNPADAADIAGLNPVVRKNITINENCSIVAVLRSEYDFLITGGFEYTVDDDEHIYQYGTNKVLKAMVNTDGNWDVYKAENYMLQAR